MCFFCTLFSRSDAAHLIKNVALAEWPRGNIRYVLKRVYKLAEDTGPGTRKADLQASASAQEVVQCERTGPPRVCSWKECVTGVPLSPQYSAIWLPLLQMSKEYGE